MSFFLSGNNVSRQDIVSLLNSAIFDYMRILAVGVIWVLGSLTLLGQVHRHDHSHRPGEGFVPNHGQFEDNTLYKHVLPNGSMFLEADGFTFNLFDAELLSQLHLGTYEDDGGDVTMRCHAYRMRLQAPQPVRAQGSQPFPWHHNYFLGEDESRWASRVPIYEQVTYPGIYEGIDLVVRHDAYGHLKYEFVVAPGLRHEPIRWSYEGADSVSIQHGQLVIHTSLGEVREARPYAYQEIEGTPTKVACQYFIEDGRVGFNLPNGYDQRYPLVIDPTLIFSTYSGSSANNFGYTATFDARGYLYSGSTSFGNGYPTTLGAYQQTWAGGTGGTLIGLPQLVGTDMVITKWDTNGTQPIYSTYLGGASDEMPHSMIVNEQQELYVMGTTSSLNFPTTPSAFDTSFNFIPATITPVNLVTGLGVYFPNGSDIVVTKFDSTGNSLLASTFLGGTHNDGVNTGTTKFNYADEVRGEILIDGQQNVYIASCTRSSDNPAGQVTSFQPNKPSAAGVQDGIIYKLNFDLSILIWTGYLGGNSDDAVYSIALDENDNAYVSGGTASNNFPTTPGAYDNSFNGDRDGFVSLIRQTGDSVLHSTFFGSAGYDQSYFVETDNRNFVYIFGQTAAPNGQLILNANYNDPLGGQFVTKFGPDLDTLVWSTRFGTGDGTPDISPTAFLVDLCNAVYLSGWGSNIQGGGLSTTGLDTAGGALQGTTDGNDFYLAVIADDASSLNYGSFFGGSAAEHVDGGTSRFDKKGKIYQAVCAGCGGTSDFPTLPNPGAHSNTNGASAASGCNLAVFKIDFLLPVVVADFLAPSDICAPFTVDFENVSLQQSATSFIWDFGTGDSSTVFEPSYTYTTPGLYTVRLIVQDTNSCNLADTLEKTISVINDSTYVIPNAQICSGIPTQIGLIGTQPGPGVSFTWDPPVFLSDPTIPAPIANPPTDTTYRVYVFNGICTDTIVQRVVLDDALVEPMDDTTICSQNVPFTISATSFGTADTFIWSSQPNFSDTLNFILTDSSVAVFPVNNQNTYYIRVISPDGCISEDSMQVNLQDIQNPLVASFDDPGIGCAPVTVNFTNTSNLFTNTIFEWDFGTGDTSQAVNPSYVFTQRGTYSVLLTAFDTSACSQVDSFRMDITIDADSNYTLDILACAGQETQLGVDPADYPNGTFTWDPAGAVSDPTQADPTGVFTTDTTLLLIAQENCRDSITHEITVEAILAQAPPLRLTCSDQLPLLLRGTGFGTGQSFVWSLESDFSNPLNSLNDSTLSAEPAEGRTVYYFQVESPNGCLESDMTEILVSDYLLEVSPDASLCFNDTATLTATNLYPANPLSYDWAPVASILGPNDQPVVRVAPVDDTQYLLTTVNDSGCVRMDTITVGISTLDPQNVAIISDRDTIVRSQSVRLEGFPDQGSFGYQWQPPAGVDAPNSAVTSASPSETTTYTLNVQDLDHPQCIYSTQKTIYVRELICGPPEIEVPTAFTPNGDGINDILRVAHRNITSLEFKIFNRWGELVFETTDMNRGWDGEHRDAPADPAVYVYYLDVQCIDGQTFFQKGNITLIR